MKLNILIVRIGMTGDTLFTLPLIKTLKAAYPAAKITGVISPKGKILTELFEEKDRFDETIVYDFYHPKIAKYLTAKKLRGNRFDAVFFLDTHLEYFHFISSLITSHQWFRMVREPDALGGTQVIQNAVGNIPHICRQYLSLAEAFGIQSLIESYKFTPPPSTQREAEKIKRKYKLVNGPVIGLHWGNHSKNTNILFPKEGFDGRSWSMDSYTELTTGIIKQFPNAKFVLTGGTYEKRLIKQLEKKIRTKGTSVLNLAGKTNQMKTLFGLLSSIDLLIVGDTGPMHLASAIGTPTIGLFFATNPKDTGPYGAPNTTIAQSPISCAPCLHTPHSFQCPTDTNCVKSLSSETIIQIALEKLKDRIR